MDHYHVADDTTTKATKNCPMIMVFHAGHCERILWKTWMASEMTEFVFSCLAFFAMAFIYEALKFIREYLLRTTVRKEAERMTIELQNKDGCNAPGGCSNSQLAEISQKSYFQRIFSAPHIIQALINIIQIALSYLLMLVFMNYNYWLCLAVILGLGLGYFVFGWIKQDVYENECCQ